MIDMRVATSEEVLTHWNTLAPWIDRGLKHSASKTSSVSLAPQIISGQMQLWLCSIEGELRSVVITEPIYFEGELVLHLICMSGDGWDEYKEGCHTLEAFAEEIGASRIVAWCRRGWTRKIKELKGRRGQTFNESYVVMDMRI